MSASAMPEPRPGEAVGDTPSTDAPDTLTAAPVVPPATDGDEESDASEFMSESSPEVKALWGAAPPSSAAVKAAVAHLTVVPPSVAPPSTASSSVAPLPAVPPLAAPVAPARSASPAAPAPAAAPAMAPTSTPVRRGLPWLTLLLVIAAAVAVTAYFVQRSRLTPPPAPRPPSAVIEGSVTIVSRPAGAQVLIDGTVRGVTPLKLSLPVGTYDLELQGDAAKRSLTVTVDPSTSVREFVDLAPDGGLGNVEVTTDTPGARVTVDGTSRGVTPLVVRDLQAGSHRVGVTTEDGTIFRTVTVTAGATATVVASAAPSSATGGWLTIASPIELQVIENGEIIGSSSATRIMLPVGRHDLQLVSTPYEFETSVTTPIAAGRTVTVPVAMPNGTLSINASPWADVFVDGRAVGSTPIGNVPVTVGPHTVVWRHPQLGERQQTVRVGARTPARASVDLTRAP
jgi:hypothetical protein